MLPTIKNNATEIKFENVSVNLDGNVILDNISVNIPKGSCTAIIGPNGAGKTTFIQSLLGAIDSTGNVSLTNGDDSPVQIGYIPQKTNFDRGLPLLFWNSWLWVGKECHCALSSRCISSKGQRRS